MFDFAINFINNFFTKLWDLFKLLIDAIFTALGTFLYMLWDGFLFVVTNLISTLDLSSLAFTQYASWANIPDQLTYLVNQLALPQCASIVGGAILIRMILNLIPTWATRV